MKYRALRGVCIGVDRNLAVGDVAELDPATANYLKSIGAVEDLKEPPRATPVPALKPESISQPAKPGTKEK